MQVDAATNTCELVETKSVATQTDPEVESNPADHDPNEEEELDSDSTVGYSTDDKADTSGSDYTDPEYSGPPSQSQACFNIRGHSYTPPGWKRVCVKRRHSSRYAAYYAAKKIKFN